MCGIAGAFTLGPHERPVPEGVIDAMIRVLVHRGPDGAGTFRNHRAALGHRRLSIIDLSDDAAQPMFNEDETLVLVFNGEIYNFAELRADLEASGHTFRSRSDGEVILHLYEEHGTACVNWLQGMFAFCIHDIRSQEIYLARDRVGEKPLYYAMSGEEFYFCSEIKGLFASGCVPKRLCHAGVNASFNYVQIPAPLTVFEGVHKLPPAHWMLVDARGIRTIQQYWHLEFRDKADLSTEEAVERLHELMVDAVRKMVVSDVPLGLMLSGGVDSTLILAIASEMGVRNIQTFTVGNPRSAATGHECRRALAVAKRFGTRNHVFDFDQPDFDVLLHSAAECDEPIGLPEIFYHFGVFCHVRPHAKVVLTGNGADELFGGYDTYNSISRLSAAFAWTRPILSRANRVVNAAASSYFVHRNHAILEPYFTEGCGRWRRDSAALMRQSMRVASYDNLLDAKLFADLSILCNHALSALPDTSAMSSSVELRSPFLHVPIMEFAAALKSDMKVRNGTPMLNKHIVKLLLARFIDPADVYVPKYGFGHFINHYDLMKTIWKADVTALIADDAIQELKLFNQQHVENTWRRFLRSELADREQLLFARYLMFVAWYKYSFLDACV